MSLRSINIKVELTSKLTFFWMINEPRDMLSLLLWDALCEIFHIFISKLHVREQILVNPVLVNNLLWLVTLEDWENRFILLFLSLRFLFSVLFLHSYCYSIHATWLLENWNWKINFDELWSGTNVSCELIASSDFIEIVGCLNKPVVIRLLSSQTVSLRTISHLVQFLVEIIFSWFINKNRSWANIAGVIIIIIIFWLGIRRCFVFFFFSLNLCKSIISILKTFGI
jgi:hypothetical protein